MDAGSARVSGREGLTFAGRLPTAGRRSVRTCRSFGEFWPAYLAEHRLPRTRALHDAGTSLVVLFAIASLLTRRWMLLTILPLAGHGFAWTAHAFVERNGPATFTYPLSSLAADFRMWALWLAGRMPSELARLGLGETKGGSYGR